MFADDVKPPLPLPLDLSSYNPILTEPTPHYAWGSEVAYAASAALAQHHHHQQARLSPASEASEHSLQSVSFPFRSGSGSGSHSGSHSNSGSHSGSHSHSHTGHTPLHLSPSLSSASTASVSSQDSPMLMASTPPLWDDGEPYKPAPMLPVSELGAARVDLAPLETLPRSHMYRRCPADDRALRLLALGPGAR